MPTRTEENEKHLNTAGLQTEIWTQDVTNTVQGAYHSASVVSYFHSNSSEYKNFTNM
jgi:hypothetical protein